MIYTILVNWNGWRDTIECLDSLLLADHDGLTVMVCDNASADDSLVGLREWADARLTGREDIAGEVANSLGAERWTRAGDGATFRFVLVEVGRNAGFAGGNNVGIAHALVDPACSFIFVLNNDTAVYPDTLRKLEAKMARSPEVAICGPTLVYFDRRDTVQALGGTYNRFAARARHLHGHGALSDLPTEADLEPQLLYIVGAAIFARPGVFRRLGGLCEDYFLYYEELDLSQKLLPDERLGWASDALVAHKVGGSIGTGGRDTRPSDTSIYYDHRSKVRFYWTYWKPYLPFLALNLAKSSAAYLRRGDVRAVRTLWAGVIDFATRPKDYRRSFPKRG